MCPTRCRCLAAHPGPPLPAPDDAAYRTDLTPVICSQLFHVVRMGCQTVKYDDSVPCQ